MRSLLAAVAAILAFASPAAAQDWMTAPMLDDPTVAESWPIAVQFWVETPGVAPLDVACPNGVPIRVIENSPLYAGYGLQRDANFDCGIWYELAYLRTMAAWPDPYSAAQARCYVLIHELGHALGLAHSADPTNVMYGEYGTIPQVCIDYWQPPRPIPGLPVPVMPIAAPVPPPMPQAIVADEPEPRSVTRKAAIVKVRSKLGKRWRYFANSAGYYSSDGGVTNRVTVIEVTAKRKRCVKRRCKTIVKQYQVEYGKTRLRMTRIY